MKTDLTIVGDSAYRIVHHTKALNQEGASESQQRLAGYALDGEYRYFALALRAVVDQLPHLKAMITEALSVNDDATILSRLEAVPLTLELPEAVPTVKETDPDKLLEEFLKD